MNNLLALIDGLGKELGQGGVIAIASIALVFAILAIIIVISFFAGSLIGKSIKNNKVEEPKLEPTVQRKTTNITDEDAMVAVLVASIDMRNETKKDVKLVSIKEIK